MRKLKLAFLSLAAIGFFSLVGCTKKYITTVSGSDSVYTSSWITLSMQFNTTDSAFEQTISAPSITSAILNDGVILGYGAYQVSSGDTIVENAIDFGLYQNNYVGNILLQNYGIDDTNLWYRYVIIPGKVLTTKGLTPLQARALTYAEMTRLLAPTTKTSASPTVQ